MENTKCVVGGCPNKQGGGLGYVITLLKQKRFICNPCLQFILYGKEHCRMTKLSEHCICAAWKAQDNKIYKGHRHIHCLDAMEDARTTPAKNPASQGFITSTGRFVDRYEGYKLQIAAGIESIAEGGYRGERLFSEDLY
jgi:hypothetical protein